MNQQLDIATRILASLLIARPSGNPETQAADALNRATALLDTAKARGIDTTDCAPPTVQIISTAPADTMNVSTTRMPDPTPRPLSFGAKRKS